MLMCTISYCVALCLSLPSVVDSWSGRVLWGCHSDRIDNTGVHVLLL